MGASALKTVADSLAVFVRATCSAMGDQLQGTLRAISVGEARLFFGLSWEGRAKFEIHIRAGEKAVGWRVVVPCQAEQSAAVLQSETDRGALNALGDLIGLVSRYSEALTRELNAGEVVLERDVIAWRASLDRLGWPVRRAAGPPSPTPPRD